MNFRASANAYMELRGRPGGGGPAQGSAGQELVRKVERKTGIEYRWRKKERSL